MEGAIVLLNRQRNGAFSSLKTIARSLRSGPVDCLLKLVELHHRNLIVLGRWPHSPITVDTALFAIPTPDVMKEVDASWEELKWPILTNELLRGNFAARIYLYNKQENPQPTGRFHRNYSWEDEMKYLYQNLALTAFGPSGDWTPDLTFDHHWPTEEQEIRDLCAIHQTEPPTMRSNLPRSKGKEPVLEIRPKLTMEEALALHPEGIVSFKEIVLKALDLGIAVRRVVKYIGGDRGLYPPRSKDWRQFLIKGRRYVSRSAMEELPKLVKGYNEDKHSN